MVIVFIYFFLGFVFSSLFYIFQDKIKAFLNEDEDEELIPDGCLFLIRTLNQNGRRYPEDIYETICRRLENRGVL